MTDETKIIDRFDDDKTNDEYQLYPLVTMKHNDHVHAIGTSNNDGVIVRLKLLETPFVGYESDVIQDCMVEVTSDLIKMSGAQTGFTIQNDILLFFKSTVAWLNDAIENKDSVLIPR